MATIGTAIQMQDGVSPALKAISASMSVVTRSFEVMQHASSRAFDIKSIQTASEQIIKTEFAYASAGAEIQNAGNEQQKLNQELSNGGSAADRLAEKFNKVKDFVGTAGKAAEKVFSLSDSLTQTKTRLNFMNDGLQTTDQLQKMVYDSAQRSRGSYEDTANIVAKLGQNAKNVFGSNAQTIQFAENMNKSFAIAGAGTEEMKSASEQMTQALASGALSGEAFNSVFETAPNIIQTIADYLNVPIDKVKAMGESGQITADIVRDSMLGATDNINQNFNRLPMTWGQVWGSMQNRALMAFQPVLDKIGELTQSANFNKVVDGIIAAIVVAANIALAAFQILGSVAGFVIENWSILGPIIWGVAGILALYAIAANGVKIAEMAQFIWTGLTTGAKIVATAVTAALTHATLAEAGAQLGLNAALLACPLVWIIGIIIVLIAVFYVIIAVINKFAGTAYSATGIIIGAFLTLAAIVWNTAVGMFNSLIQHLWTIFVEPWISAIEWVMNVFNGGFDSFGDAVKNLLGQIISWFLSLGKVVTKIIDAIFGTKWTSGLDSLQSSVLKWGKNDKAITLNRTIPGIQRVSYKAAFDTGNTFGKGIENKISSLTSFGKAGPETGLETGLETGAGAGTSAFDTASALDGIQNGVDNTAGNTAKMADSMDMSNEILAYMRDVAEQDAINRFTTASVKVDFGGVTNHVNSDLDLDGVVNYIATKTTEAMATAAEGVH